MRTVVLRPLTVVSLSVAVLSCPAIARAQSVDASFNPGANQTVITIAVQPDGKTVIGGNFTGLGGGTGTTVRNRIGRLNLDGTVDAGFNPGTNAPVQAIAVQPDGRILAGGNFTAVGGGTGLTASRSHIARFNADGTVDTSFDPGANLNVYALAVQADGKILVGGNFSKLGGGGAGVTTRIGIGRLNADGSIDTAFNPGASKLPSPGAPPEIYTIVVQPDGKILLGGYFNGLGGGTGATTRNFIGRLNADGTVDSFNPGVTSIGGVNALALQADGKIVVGGTYTQLAGTNRANIGRLNPDGSLDSTFNPGAETQVFSLGVQIDGKIIAGGAFKWMGDAGGSLKSTRNYIGRLNANGTVDTGFDPGANNVVNVVALQGDGAIVAGGIFDHLGNGASLVAGAGTLRNKVGRITNSAAVQTLTLTGGSTIETWMRSGSGPEVSRVTFEFSFDGSFYSLLGSGTRVAGGWELTTGVNLPTRRALYIRARGYYETGQNGSGSIVESVLLRPAAVTAGDYDGDGKADLEVFRPSNGTWYTLSSQTGVTSANAFGVSSDVPVPGDYDGDGKADVAVYRPSSSTWYIQQSSGGLQVLQWGTSTDVPVPADYDGDFKTDVAVYRPSTSEWFIQQSGGGVQILTLGAAGDVPVPADYDGDGKADLAVFRPSTGEWFIRQSNSPTPIVSHAWGLNGDIPVPGDYDGDGKTDVAVFRAATGTWFILRSSDSSVASFQWGLNGDRPEPGDYDGDGITDITVFRPSTGTWYVLQSTTSYASSATTSLGSAGDTAVPGALIAYAMNRVGAVGPTVSVDRTSLRFSATSSGSAFVQQTASQTVHISQTGIGTVTFTATSSAPWLVVSPSSGTGPAVLTISTQFAAGLSASQTGSVTLTFTGAANTAGPIAVTLTVKSSTAAPSPAFGALDTPIGDSTVLAGSVAVTGWTLDDVGVNRVELWRDLQPGETTPPFAGASGDPRNGKAFISNVTFVDGARPDVEALYPTTPFAYRAGWGYLMLTWGLWNDGNGTYKLYAFAYDQENNVSTIGSKTIIVSNNGATRPFGSIDTPGIGADASGPNFGWGLTPKVNGVATCKIQPSGVQVTIDSGPLQPVVYGDNRTDIAGAFPGFSNTSAAGGHYIFDWSTLTNGVHTIGWLVTDDCNRADGVGSRFFNVTTGTSLVAGAMAASLEAGVRESAAAITVAHGFGELPQIVEAGEAGSRTVEVREGERVEVRAPHGFDTAYQLVAGQRRALPVGATWDPAAGAFYWQPAAGFLGRYRIVFSGGGERINVRVVVVPKG